MSWAVGYDEHWKRDIGYGVPAYCDHPDCNEEIDRGLYYVCGGEPYGGSEGCGLYFCYKHLDYGNFCERCRKTKEPFNAKPDHPDWIKWKLTDEGWQHWRDENSDEVKRLETASRRMETRGDMFKADQGKLMWDLLPFASVRRIVDVLTYGAQKYAPGQWQQVPDARKRYFAATMRHLDAWWGGEKIDPESGLPHLAHAGCCLLFLMWFDGER